MITFDCPVCRTRFTSADYLAVHMTATQCGRALERRRERSYAARVPTIRAWLDIERGTYPS